ncbi:MULTISPECIES: tetratricopeptide repeat protein [Flavobacterium]|uniref:Tetratricopeptide repeat protein n=1 Tax=Flavobacterium jumunjinense TaxID=998845 RepID=A0ABV5GQA2_9FLAO|nr:MULTISPECIES: tetratricopeptide repeat protein [Flavobacterium]
MKNISLLFFFFSQILFSQTLSEKDFIKYQDNVSFHINGKLDSAFYYVDKIKPSKSNAQLAYAFAAEAYLYQLKKYPDTLDSNKSLERAIIHLNKIANSLEKKKISSKVYNFKGLINWKRKKLGDAIRNYEEAKKIAIEVDDKILAVKCSNNMALILAEVGNYELAIYSVRESDRLLDKTEYLYTKENFLKAKSSIYIRLATFYENYYNVKKNEKLLDSSEFYYNRAIVYSKNLFDRKLKAQTNLANIYVKKGQLKNAEKQYLASLVLAKQNDLMIQMTTLYYNLGYVNYGQKKYEKALVYFNKVDSISSFETNRLEQINTMYYLAKIHNQYENYREAERYLELYNAKFKKSENLIVEETLNVNLFIANKEVKEDVEFLKKEVRIRVVIRLLIQILIGIVFLSLVYFLYKNYIGKKQANSRVNKLIEEFKQKKETVIEPEVKQQVRNESVVNDTSLSIDEEKENEIVEKLIQLEKSNYFLREDFNLQNTAKKIKTNTTYLSYVVNKRFEKSFSEYSNELKINYAIEEMITNPTFRKYSTQAIAETVGFKNAVSFAKSFNKRTGVTPVQFIKKIEKDTTVL